MATASSVSLNVKDYGVTTVVPDDDFARLMYYLHCLTVGVGLDVLDADLVRYKHHHLLSTARKAVVFKTAVDLSPEFFVDSKILFLDDEGEVTGSSPNTFISFSAACNVVSLQSDIIIAGKVQKVTQVMFFKSSWLKKFYTDPIGRIARAVIGTKHCSHCNGEYQLCSCNTCPRATESECKTFLDVLLDPFAAPPASSSTPASRRAPSPQPIDEKHQSYCDGCGWQYYTGARYRCTKCDDYDLCSACYNRNVHDLTHPFMQIDKPGAQPFYLFPRHKPITPSTTSTSSTTTGPATLTTPSPNPPPLPPRTHEQSTSNISPPPYADMDQKLSSFFYNTMSVTELKTFLRVRDVEFDDIRDKETLCRRAWDTHCDCMTIVELNKFLSDMNVSTAGCRDVGSKRQRAKDTFESPSRPSAPPASFDTSTIRFKKDDTVVLTGLNRAEMNGKMATVISVDHAEGKALVRLDGLDKTFKVKLENLKC